MRKWLGAAMICLLALYAACASAQMYTVRDPQYRAYYTYEDFTGSLPAAAQTAFAGLIREDDEIVCGTIALKYWTDREELQGGSAVAAVRRAGKLLLLGASYDKESAWAACIESDCFLPEDRAFLMRSTVDYSPTGTLHSVRPAIVIGEETFYVSAYQGGGLYIQEYTRDEGEGVQTVINCDLRMFDYKQRVGGEELLIYSAPGPLPVRLWAWTYGTFPRTPQQMEAWTGAHAYPLAADEGYIAGVNLRERPTGKSKSFGVYSAKVKILGQQPGSDAPWYHVRVGNLTGWVSGRYLRTAEENPYLLGASKTGTYPVGYAQKDVRLLDMPDGSEVMTIPAGKLVHVLMDNEGYLHVLVPRGELTWETDWDGIYGFVRSDEMTVGNSIADALWR